MAAYVSGDSFLRVRPSSVTCRWEPDELSAIRQPHVDHWCKMKVKANGLLTESRPTSVANYSYNLDDTQSYIPMQMSQKSTLLRPNFVDSRRFTSSKGNRLDHGTRTIFGDSVTDTVRVSLNAPSARHLGSSRGSARTPSLDNQYHQRAKQGNVYWFREKPKPTNYGHYHLGTYKTFMGIGDGPRS